MPFSDAQFAAAWTVLEDRYNRKHNAQTVKIYRDILESELTAAEFTDACRAAFRMETFFPSPQKLIDLGKGGQDFNLRALAAWDTCMTRFLAGDAATDSGTIERRLINSLTHGAGLRMIETKQLDFMKREFVQRYAAELSQQAVSVPLELPNAARLTLEEVAGR